MIPVAVSAAAARGRPPLWTASCPGHTAAGTRGRTPSPPARGVAPPALISRVGSSVGRRALNAESDVRILARELHADEAQQAMRRSCKADIASSSLAVGSMPAQHDRWRTVLVKPRIRVESGRWLQGRRTGVQRCLASSACSVRYRGCPPCPASPTVEALVDAADGMKITGRVDVHSGRTERKSWQECRTPAAVWAA